MTTDLRRAVGMCLTHHYAVAAIDGRLQRCSDDQPPSLLRPDGALDRAGIEAALSGVQQVRDGAAHDPSSDTTATMVHCCAPFGLDPAALRQLIGDSFGCGDSGVLITPYPIAVARKIADRSSMRVLVCEVASAHVAFACVTVAGDAVQDLVRASGALPTSSVSATGPIDPLRATWAKLSSLLASHPALRNPVSCVVVCGRRAIAAPIGGLLAARLEVDDVRIDDGTTSDAANAMPSVALWAEQRCKAPTIRPELLARQWSLLAQASNPALAVRGVRAASIWLGLETWLKRVMTGGASQGSFSGIRLELRGDRTLVGACRTTVPLPFFGDFELEKDVVGTWSIADSGRLHLRALLTPALGSGTSETLDLWLQPDELHGQRLITRWLSEDGQWVLLDARETRLLAGTIVELASAAKSQ